MRLKIKRLVLDHFKGVEHMELNLDGKNAKIKGVNGSGKTTIAESVLWTFADCNYELTKNPPVTPLGMTEVETRVDIEMDISGTPVTVSKKQKFKSKTDDSGKTTSAITNSYEVNSVEKSYRDFVADMESRGLDMSNFLILSHPLAFTADTSKAGREKMRETLFKMAEDLTDLEIAYGLDGATEIKALLETYRLDEIESMQKATLRKITENCGKDNSVINAKIDGLIASKVQGNVSDLEIQLETTNKMIADLENELKDDSRATIKAKIAELETQASAIEKTEMNVLDEARRKLRKQISDVELDIEIARQKVQTGKYNISNTKDVIRSCEEFIEEYREEYKKVQDSTLDEDDKVCPTCHREYPEDMLEQIKADFENNKSIRLKAIKDRADEKKHNVAESKIKLESQEKEKAETEHVLEVLEGEISDLKAELDKIPTSIDLSENKDWKDLDAQIKGLKASLAGQKDNTALKDKLSDLRIKANALTKMIGAVEHNKEIDAKVDELREERMTSEINRANAEKILDQVDRLKRLKNEKLTESINSHFRIISFKLWDFRKNGEYVDTVEILLDNKPISKCANGSLITLAQVDCINGLQNFFDQHFPVWCDDAALITSNTAARLELDSQYIQLIAADGVNELTIETED